MSFPRLLSEALAAEQLPSTEDVLAVGIPLLRQLQDLHRSGMVSKVEGLDHVEYEGIALSIDPDMVQRPRLNEAKIAVLNPLHGQSGVQVTARNRIDSSLRTDGGQLRSDDVLEPGQMPDRPMFAIGYRAWEQALGHHDELTDLYLAGLLLVSYAGGLDLDLEETVSDLALNQRHLHRLCPTLHPVVAGVLSEMISPDRHERPDDATQILARLEHHRELPSDLDLTDAYGSAGNWQLAVLETLRERVFDTTRRNRALYFRSSATALSLTEASVPLLLNESRIKPEDILTWTGSSAEAFRSGKPVDLERWCRFEENPYLRPGLEKILSSERKLRSEHGQGRLHLVAAFLRWFDPVNNEVVHSPLLVMRAELTKRKGVHSRYLVEVDQMATVNPILRHVLKSRFGLELVEEIASDLDSIRTFVSHLESAIQSTEPALRVELIERPQVRLIKRKAQLRVDAYHRRRAQALASSGRWRRQDHSYDPSDWRPLGLSLYQRFVLPTVLPLRDLAGAAPAPRSGHLLSPGARQQATTQSTIQSGPGSTPSLQTAATAPTGPRPPTAERTSTGYVLSTGDVSPQRWEVDLCSVTLASLGSRKTTIARDYDALLETPLSDVERRFAGSPFVEMFSPDPRASKSDAPPPISLDQILVLPADAAQAVAVRRGVRGDSFIIQGPPGTGKSQTITNLIAALVAEGKRVLFVCEKRAALDVVAHRLRQVGLEEMAATIHDSQLDRRSFISELGQTYEHWIDHDGDDARSLRERTLKSAEGLLRPLELAFEDLNVKPAGSSLSIAQLVNRAILLGSSLSTQDSDFPKDRGSDLGGAERPTINEWLSNRPKLDLVSQSLSHAGLDPRLGTNPQLRIRPQSFDASNALEVVDNVTERLQTALDTLVESTKSTLSLSSISLDWLHALLARGSSLGRLERARAIETLNVAGPQYRALQEARQDQSRLRADAQRLTEVASRWHSPLSAADTAVALRLASEKEGTFFGFLDRRWRATKKMVEAAYNFSVHQINPTISSVLEELTQFHQASDDSANFEASVLHKYGSVDLDAIDQLVRDVGHHPITALAASAPDAVSIIHVLQAAQLVVDVCRDLFVAPDVSAAELAGLVEELRTTSYRYERPLVEWSKLRDAPASVLLTVLGQGLKHSEDTGDTEPESNNVVDPSGFPTLDQIEYAIIDAALTKSKRRGVGGMPGAQLDSAVEALLEIQGDLRSANAEFGLSMARDRFTQHVNFSDASMAGRSDDDKAFKRSYNAGRKLLEREFQKKMRFRSIRELASGDSGLVVRDLKPIWLMSPLSVSDTLPLDEDLFDVVIFDEASQIPVEDAIPTLFRSRQVIVVGDRMQLPPTRFFSSETDEEHEIIADEDGHRLSISLEADSFLAQADLALESTMLSWHYRSRFESLIAYSNHAFYDAQLATVPDRGFDHGIQEPLIVRAAEDARQHLPATLDRPISFHKLSHGSYQDRRNEAEADYIAEMVRGLLGSDSSLTIGIVAFSEAQQRAIEEALAELATLDQSFREQLEEEQTRSDDDEFVGLFVKNLENVQGDERDIIIMSVCYAPSPEGKMRMNFGPINQSGGERRLNVIFSRAKQHMAIVSSITGSQITNRHNDGAAHLAQFLDYAEAESDGKGSLADSLLGSLRPGNDERHDPQLRSAAGAALANELTKRGFVVDMNVGRSVFTVDVAVRGEHGYRLGVLIDPGPAGAEATARLVAEAGVLKAFGWPITRLLVTEWLHSPTRVADRIEQTLRALPD